MSDRSGPLRGRSDPATRPDQLDPQSLAVQSVGGLIGSPALIAGKLPYLIYG